MCVGLRSHKNANFADMASFSLVVDSTSAKGVSYLLLQDLD